MLFLTLPLNSVLNRHANFDLHNEKTGVKMTNLLVANRF